MKMIFGFRAKEKEYKALAGKIRERITILGDTFARSRSTFVVNRDIFYDGVWFNYSTNEISGRAFIDSYNDDIHGQMKRVRSDVELRLKTAAKNFHYHPAATWERSSDAESYTARTGNRTLSGLSGFVN